MSTPESENEKPKIIVDEDWKSRVERERAELDEPGPSESTAAPSEAAPSEASEIPPASFEFLISTLFTQAMMALGHMPNPVDGKASVELDLARHHIDMLVVLEEKTQGNLSPQETKMMNEIIHTLRMAFVDAQAN